MRLYRYTCGHVGRINASYLARAEAFIRVAEIRRTPVENSDEKCPDCRSRAAV